MKKILYLSLFLSFTFLRVNCQINKEDLKNILEKTSELELPFTTRNIDLDKVESLDKNLAISFFLNGDESRLYYEAYVFDIDNQRNISKKRTYFFSPIAYSEFNNTLVLLYNVRGNNMSKIILATIRNLEIIDTLTISYSIGEYEVEKYREGNIDENLGIQTKSFERNYDPVINKDDSTKNEKTPKSLVTVSTYKLNPDDGKIVLIKSNTLFSNCSPDEYTYKNNCDLFNK